MSKRKIGPLLATALVASNMIGSGVFLLPASLASILRSISSRSLRSDDIALSALRCAESAWSPS